MSFNFKNKLHIYGQDLWHDTAFIVGDQEALIALRDAIDAALVLGQAKSVTCAADGEGYDVFIYNEHSEGPFWDNPLLPYIDHITHGSEGPDPISPWDLYKNYKKQATSNEED